ncbi:MAG: hypothetical protein CMB80_00075 [Flammeovirgaceae bacterium]|jgi:hypothetical protein|nr:hypothetical protein [Flammeovirgaceae bacterium]|tara:strand:+ start:4727 stop:4969 length:243 start_codon:yes stop_codon:yes gene_type:complete
MLFTSISFAQTKTYKVYKTQNKKEKRNKRCSDSGYIELYKKIFIEIDLGEKDKKTSKKNSKNPKIQMSLYDLMCLEYANE